MAFSVVGFIHINSIQKDYQIPWDLWGGERVYERALARSTAGAIKSNISSTKKLITFESNQVFIVLKLSHKKSNEVR